MEVLNHVLQIGAHITFLQESHVKVSHCYIKEKWVMYSMLQGKSTGIFGFNKLISSHENTDPNVPNCGCRFVICLLF